ncbi:carbohydrate binding domain-containing protein [Paenibacillus radicis (ex Gao et al. 2016)]|uniref:CBM6 domain-containing protein n=1 Tax=Paenibacillus radicis (ex Gao et al. 2016) TaxID=1737354 RepID=A0A917GWH7_9BACL|nr:carbohydrate binding domain-containing protein [Paenibacillus radicis (ex Gao et al. 2016)]GGG59604.1 hypothetical protein GCM10010918_10980 [Paenibacillus radicis (ex Gao et al. 2016)]
MGARQKGKTWKRLLSFAVAGTVASSLVVSSPAYPLSAAGTNSVQNPGFEAGNLSGWADFSGANVVTAFDQVRSGSYAVRTTGLIEQTIGGLSPNTTYMLTGWAKGSSVNVDGRIGVKDYGGNELQKEIRSVSYTNAVLVFTTGPSDTSTKIFLWNANGVGELYGDDFTLEQVTNYAVNGGFESGSAAPWSSGAAIVSSGQRTGAKAVSTSNSAELTVTGLSPNTMYSLIGYAKAGSAGVTARVGVKNYGGSENNLPVTSTGWTQVSIPFLTGGSNTSATIYLWNPAGSGTVFGDDFFVTRVKTDYSTPNQDISFTSSDSVLNDNFAWAKSQAKSYMTSGLGNNFASYWNGYTFRSALYSRDFAHASLGAHLLGMDAENYQTLQKFAASANASRKWYPLWALNFSDVVPYYTDYNSDTSFVREIPAVFELTEKGYKQYLWTGNTDYINDPALVTYYEKSVNDFIALHDANGNGIADEGGTGDIFKGTATYNENPSAHLKEAGDAIGSQYQALLAYSQIQSARGDSAGSGVTAGKASSLKSLFNSTWVNTSSNRFIRGWYDSTKYDNFGKENSWFMPMKLITNPGSTNNNYLDYIDSQVKGLAPFNIEAYTYLPETFFPYQQNDRGVYWLKYIGNSRSTYPEVGFTVVGHTVEGLMGVVPDAPNHKVETLSHLPESVTWGEVNHVAVGDHDLKVKHEGVGRTTLTHNYGSQPLQWEATFPGTHSQLFINDVAQPASTKVVNGVAVSSVTVSVPVGSSIVVRANIAANLIKNAGFEAGTADWTFTSGTGIASNIPHSGSKLAYLDAGTAKQISQSFMIPESGTYTLKAWVAAGGSGGVLGVKVNGSAAGSVAIPNVTAYNEQSITGIVLNAGDSVQVYVTGPTSQWINVDDFSFTKQ